MERCQFRLWWKREAGKAQEIWVWISKHVENIVTFWHFWSVRIPQHKTKSKENSKETPTQVRSLGLKNWRKKSNQEFRRKRSLKNETIPILKKFGSFGISRFQKQAMKLRNFSTALLKKNKLFDWNFTERSQAFISCKRNVETKNPNNSKSIAFLG